MAAHGRLKHPVGDTWAVLHSIGEFAVVILVTLGVAGTLYRLAGPDGWLAAIFSRSAAAGLAAIFSILLVGVSAWMLRGWVPRRQRRRYPEVAGYVLAALGLFYAFEMYSKGSL